MAGEHDNVVLTDQEQRALIELEDAVAAADPDLSRRLGQDRPQGTRAGLVAGAVLLVVGASLMMIAAATDFWLAAVGAALIAGAFIILIHRLAAGRGSLGNQRGGSPPKAA